MKPIQFGLVLPTEIRDPHRRPAWTDNLKRALDLAAGHFDSAWCVDHLQFGDADVLEGFTTLAYMAAHQPQLKFGHAVLCQSFRNPALMAKMGATLQFLTSGRYILGIGAGWHAEEYRAYGYDFPTDSVRVKQLEEALQIIRAMWTEVKVTFHGQHYNVNEAYCEPRPDPVPTIMVGAFRPKMLRLAAQYADWWNVSSSHIDRYRGVAEAFDRACVKAGRDPAAVRRTWIGGCACGATPAEAERLAAGRIAADDLEDFGFVGTPQQLADQMRRFIDLGVDYFMLDCGGFPELTTLELLISEVLPALKD